MLMIRLILSFVSFDFQTFSQISKNPGAWVFENLAKLGATVKLRPDTLLEIVARFQAGFLASEDFDGILMIL